MTKANPNSFSSSTTDQESSPQVDHGLFPSNLSADDEDQSTDAAASDNGGGTSGSHGNGTAG